jgi:hypothetical protein
MKFPSVKIPFTFTNHQQRGPREAAKRERQHQSATRRANGYLSGQLKGQETRERKGEEAKAKAFSAGAAKGNARREERTGAGMTKFAQGAANRETRRQAKQRPAQRQHGRGGFGR